MAQKRIIRCLCDYAGKVRSRMKNEDLFFCLDLVLPLCIVSMSKVIRKVLDMNPVCV